MRVFRSLGWKERLWCLFFPARCLSCGRAVEPRRYFCRECAPSLPQSTFFKEFPLPGVERRLPVAAVFPYEEGFRRTLHRLKFNEERYLAVPLGQLMADAAGAFPGPFHEVTWVPMTEKKLAQRGYDQSALLARSMAKELGLPCRKLLFPTRDMGVQHQLSRKERADNVRDAYKAGNAARGKNLLLVDDIVTTGATLRSCALALYQAGARGVWCICAASTPIHPGEELPPDEPIEA